MREPLFPSANELERQMKVAKQLRREFLVGVATIAKHKFAHQSRKLRTLDCRRRQRS
jgi:hypothetical protein